MQNTATWKTSLELKVGLIFLLLAITFNLGTLVAMQWMIFPAFTELEHQAARERLARTQDLLDSELNSLADIGHEYSRRTQSWKFLHGEAPQYVEENLNTANWKEIDVEVMAFFSTDGEPIWGRALHPETGILLKREQIHPSTYSRIRKLLSQPSGTTELSGIISLPAGIMMMVSQPVVQSSGTGPIAGYFILGRFLTESRRQLYSERIDVDFHLAAPPPDAEGEVDTSALPSLDLGKIRLAMDEEKDLLISSRNLIDLFGEQALLLEASTPRAITHMGNDIKRMSGGFLALVSLLFILISWGMIHYLVILPLNRLRVHMAQVRKTGNLSLTLDLDRLDEIGTLAREFDVTTAKLQKAYNDLERARDDAVSGERKKSEFLASMSHEIRTPMNGVIGMTELLLRTELSQTQLRLVDTVKTSASSLLAIVNDILDFSGIDTGRVVIDQAPFSLPTLINEVNATVSEPAERAGLTYDCRVKGDLPQDVIGDSVRIKQILVNLIGNAIKFTKEGEITFAVELQNTWREGNTDHCILKFSVTDTGIGISPEVEKKIFSAFAKADNSPTREFEGTGLGLSISKLLVTLMGGEIGFSSTMGQGTTFWFTIPASFNHALPNQGGELPRAKERLAGLKCLVVENDEQGRSQLLSQLENWDVNAHACHSTDEALQLLESAAHGATPFQLLLLGHHGDNSGALELAPTVAKTDKLGHPAIIVITSQPGMESSLANSTLGVNACLSTPVSQDGLFAQISNVLHREYPSDPAPPIRLEGADLSGAMHIEGEVLIVEDNAVNLELVVQQVQGFGCHVVTANNGEHAIATLEQHTFDLVIMDCQMPVMDGFEATRIIRERDMRARSGAALPVLALTANAFAGYRERCLDAGMNDFIAKPFSNEELFATIRALMTGDDNTGVLDESALERLRALQQEGAPDLVSRLIDLYIDNSKELIAALGDSITKEDIKAIEMGAHTLKSSSANLGAVQFSELCARIEHMSRNRLLDGIQELFAQLQGEFPKVCEALERNRGT